MATTVKSDNVTAVTALPSIALDRKVGRIKTQIDSVTVATTSIDEIGDTILALAIPSNAVLLDVAVMNTDLDTNASPTLAVNVGLVYSGIGGIQAKTGKTIGVAADVDVFAAASVVLQSAHKVFTSVRCETDSIAEVKKEAWEVAGLAADPGGLLLVNVTVTAVAATAAAGTLVLRVDYI